jgi:hypothetical protein
LPALPAANRRALSSGAALSSAAGSNAITGAAAAAARASTDAIGVIDEVDTVTADSAVAGAEAGVDDEEAPPGAEVLPPVKLDTHETRGRARVRLLATAEAPIKALSYAEFGRATRGAAAADEDSAKRAASAAALAAASSGTPSGGSVGAGAAGGDEVSRLLAKAGAIKDVSTAAAEGAADGAADAGPDDAADAERRAVVDADASDSGSASVRGRGESTAEEDDEDDTGSDAGMSVATSVTLGSSGSGGGSGGGGSGSGAISTKAAASAGGAATGSGGAASAASAATAAAITKADAAKTPAMLAAEEAAAEADAAAATAAFVPSLHDRSSDRTLEWARASLVKTSGYAPGALRLTEDGVLKWSPRHPEEPIDPEDATAHTPDIDAVAPPSRPRRWRVEQVLAVFLRCFRLQDCGLEFFVAPFGGPRRRRYFLAFEGGAPSRDRFVHAVWRAMPKSTMELLHARFGALLGGMGGSVAEASVNAGAGFTAAIYGSVSGNGVGHAYVQVPRPPPAGTGSGASVGFAYNYERAFRQSMGELTSAWRSRRLSNFDYLMALNTLAGRSFHDLAQYPIMPWVIGEYATGSLDLAAPGTYRDLSRPMGALTSDRLREFRSRFDTFDDDAIPKFLYGSHYSTGVGTVTHYLIRTAPFTRIHLSYQDGHYDVADRLFTSVGEAWNLNTHSLSEVKELTPEWYSSPGFLVNHSRYGFGSLQEGGPVDHVRLPPWARSPAHFTRVLRCAMESEWVSATLHNWVDLVFGYKQRGPASVASDNVFYYMTYVGGVDIDAIDDPILRKAMAMQITHYGQTPLQLLRVPHPPRGPCPTPHTPTPLPQSPSSAVLAALSSGSLFTAAAAGSARRGAAAALAASGKGGAGAGGVGGGASVASTLRHLTRTAVTAVKAVGAVASGAVTTAKNAVAPATNTLRLARALIADLRRHALTLDGAAALVLPAAALGPGGRSATLALGSPKADLALSSYAGGGDGPHAPTAALGAPSDGWASVRAAVSRLPFSLVVNRAFSHLCSVPSAGFSVWRPDTPSAMPLGVQLMCRPPNGGSGGAGSAASDSSGATGLRAADATHVSFGDVLCLGGSPPPSTLTLRVPAHALRAVVDTRGATGLAWPRAFPDPYTTAAESAHIRSSGSVAAASSPGHASGAAAADAAAIKPFALPLRFHKVCELGGAAAPAPGAAAAEDEEGGADAGTDARADGSQGSGAGTGAGGDAGGSGAAAAATTAFSTSRFHVWWPVAPAGYVALGCVVTADTVVRISQPVAFAPGPGGTPGGAAGGGSGSGLSALQSGGAAGGASGMGGAGAAAGVAGAAGGPPRFITVIKTRPTPPDADAVVCVHLSCVSQALLDAFVPLQGLALNVPPKPRAEQIVFRAWGARGAAAGGGVGGSAGGAARVPSSTLPAGAAAGLLPAAPAPAGSAASSSGAATGAGAGAGTGTGDGGAMLRGWGAVGPHAHTGSAGSGSRSMDSLVPATATAAGSAAPAAGPQGSIGRRSGSAGVTAAAAAALRGADGVDVDAGHFPSGGGPAGAVLPGSPAVAAASASFVAAGTGPAAAGGAAITPPEDEWVITDDAATSPLPFQPGHAFGASQAGSSSVGVAGQMSRNTVFSAHESAAAEEEDAALYQSGAAGGGPESASDRAAAAAAAAGNSAARTIVSAGATPASVARQRAHKSKGMALYSVGNRAGTFVIPCPVSAQRLATLQARMARAAHGFSGSAGSASGGHLLTGSGHTLTGSAGSAAASAGGGGGGGSGRAKGGRSSSDDGDDDLLSLAFVSAARTHAAHSAAAASAGALARTSGGVGGSNGIVSEGGASGAGGGSAAGGALCPEWVLASTAVPPVAEPSDAQYHKAHALCAAVAYELGEVLLQKLQRPPLPGTPAAAAAAAAPAATASSLGGAAPAAAGAALPAIRFQDQNWSADSAVSSAPSVPTFSFTAAAAAPLSTAGRAGSTGGTGTGSAAVLGGHAYASSGVGAAAAVASSIRPAVVCIRVLASSNVMSSLLGQALPQFLQSSALTLVPPHTVLAIDALGHVDRFRVLAAPTHSAAEVEGFVEAVSGAVGRALGLADEPPAPAVGGPGGRTHGSGGSGSDAAGALSLVQLPKALLPHLRLRLVRTSAGSGASLPCLPLTNYLHSFRGPPATRASTPALAVAPVDAAGSAEGLAASSGRVQCMVSHPVVACDMANGALVVTGAGRATGAEMHALDFTRGRGVPGSVLGGPGGAAGATAAGASASGGAPGSAGGAGGGSASGALTDAARAGGKPGGAGKGLPHTATPSGSALDTAAAGAAGDEDETLWAGSGDVRVTGALALPGSVPGVCVTALALDVDTLLAGFSDGSVALWRVSGLDGLSSLLAWPSCRARPDVVLRGPGVGGVLSVSLSRDDDTGVICYAGEVWVYELARGRPLQQILLASAGFGPNAVLLTGAVSPVPADAAAGAATAGAVGAQPALPVLHAVTAGACVNAEAGVIVAANLLAAAPAPASETAAEGAAQAAACAAEVLLFDATATAVAMPRPSARLGLPARVSCLTRLRGGGVGDWEGPGAVIAVGTEAGDVILIEGRSLTRLASWRTPGGLAVHCIDVSPDMAYLVAGCANGTVAALALPAFSVVVPTDLDAEREGMMHTLVGGAVALGSAAITSVETAKGVARSAKAIASETGTAVKGFLGSFFGGKR